MAANVFLSNCNFSFSMSNISFSLVAPASPAYIFQTPVFPFPTPRQRVVRVLRLRPYCCCAVTCPLLLPVATYFPQRSNTAALLIDSISPVLTSALTKLLTSLVSVIFVIFFLLILSELIHVANFAITTLLKITTYDDNWHNGQTMTVFTCKFTHIKLTHPFCDSVVVEQMTTVVSIWTLYLTFKWLASATADVLLHRQYSTRWCRCYSN